MPDGFERLGPTRLEQLAAHLARSSPCRSSTARATARARAQDIRRATSTSRRARTGTRAVAGLYQAILERLAQRRRLAPLPQEVASGRVRRAGRHLGEQHVHRRLSRQRGTSSRREGARQLNPGAERFGWTPVPARNGGPRAATPADVLRLVRPFVERLLAEANSRFLDLCRLRHSGCSTSPRIVSLWVAALIFRNPKLLSPGARGRVALARGLPRARPGAFAGASGARIVRGRGDAGRARGRVPAAGPLDRRPAAAPRVQPRAARTPAAADRDRQPGRGCPRRLLPAPGRDGVLAPAQLPGAAEARPHQVCVDARGGRHRRLPAAATSEAGLTAARPRIARAPRRSSSGILVPNPVQDR
jgi:hypothetical protein